VPSPPWVLEDFYESMKRWVRLYDPADDLKRAVVKWSYGVEDTGPTNLALYASKDDVAEVLDLVPSTRVTILGIAVHSEWRFVVVEILG
jgi:hypothetical protein